MTVVAPEVAQAAQRILEGDDSAGAAVTSEASLHEHHPCEEEFEDLFEKLALHAPAMGSPYADYPQLCAVVKGSPVDQSLAGSS